MWNNIEGYRCLELGYILKKSCWGKSFATEGVKAFRDYGFEMFKINKIYATIRPKNKPSIAVAERLGMTLAGEYIKKCNDKQMKHLIYTVGINEIFSASVSYDFR